MRLGRCSTTGRFGRAPISCRRPATGEYGCCWPGADLARPGPALSLSDREWPHAAPAVLLWWRRPRPTRDVMVEGESGLLAVSPYWDRPRYEPSRRRLTWSNGAIATLYSADEPDRLRGPQHDAAWCDELASWRYPQAWDMLMFGLRVGSDPRVVVTTTPRPTPLLRAILQDPRVVVTRGSTYDNRANLAAAFLDQIITKYAGTHLGRQEIDAEILDDLPGALWNRSLIEASRARHAPQQRRIVVAIDPAAGSGEESDETGIIVAGRDSRGHGWVMADLSGHYRPLEWAQVATAAFHAHRADRI